MRVSHFCWNAFEHRRVSIYLAYSLGLRPTSGEGSELKSWGKRSGRKIDCWRFVRCWMMMWLGLEPACWSVASSYNNYQFLYLPFQVPGSCSYGSLLDMYCLKHWYTKYAIHQSHISAKAKGPTELGWKSFEKREHLSRIYWWVEKPNITCFSDPALTRKVDHFLLQPGCKMPFTWLALKSNLLKNRLEEIQVASSCNHRGSA